MEGQNWALAGYFYAGISIVVATGLVGIAVQNWRRGERAWPLQLAGFALGYCAIASWALLG